MSAPETPPTGGVYLTPKECQRFAYALADVNCWFSGFRAAYHGADWKPDMPPGMDALRDLKIKIGKGAP